MRGSIRQRRAMEKPLRHPSSQASVWRPCTSCSERRNKEAMHTPTHAALNFLVLGRDPKSPRPWIVAGAVLPDVPMFAFFAYERWARGESVERIFEELYFEPRWQMVFDVSHSI